ncbi:hypothetical protein BD780_003671 [Clostridium tetanomorphum]|uniref:DUF1540 domain-containing protein n=1 Tax=Clostridium tetanomorphum TaxID=1553 RepID=A0A923J131_CLOTT|nr:hypothetical protein [Clostridium tetanomorphum]KAJ50857.1 hypothetical protein CTM_15922 [Clostridium tetanomorphum DSM 665]MBC2398349.1 hypothetical protein [Clostridium tetanomorphum]MBP1865500.1 hypothetical protein [Clostridium tetanomorphum]NRS86446.1 hypothetical protein [Clostridium tetanomorphum]NRZ95525.1 hypothetical protein [Clostridium tetanomorphum]
MQLNNSIACTVSECKYDHKQDDYCVLVKFKFENMILQQQLYSVIVIIVLKKINIIPLNPNK